MPETAKRPGDVKAEDESNVSSPGKPRGSLRAELVFNLAFFAGAALLIALWTVLTIALPGMIDTIPIGVIIALLVVYVGIFVGLAHSLIGRLMLRPLRQTIETAEAIAAGDLDRRVPPGNTMETAALAATINELTDQLLEKQESLAKNVESLDGTNRLLHATQRELLQAEKLASVGRLSAGVAHEIGNPLGAIIGYLEVIRRRGGDAELIVEARSEAERIDRIVRSLLDFARPSEARTEPLDLNAAVERVVELLRSQGKLGTVEVELDLEEDIRSIRADAHRIDQLLLNLLVNADLAIEGEGRIRVKTRNSRGVGAGAARARRAEDPPEITYAHLRRSADPDRGVRFEEDEPLVELAVEDDGPGVPEAQAAAVFDPFFTTRAPGQGTGLGLAIVSSTVADYGGRIEVERSELGGARFVVHFPAIER